jgi:RNA polymerase sigma factor (sigma-70 family)
MDVGEPAVRDAMTADDLFARHYVHLVRLAAQLVDDVESAEDIVQDVFAALDLARLRGDALPYLRTAVVNRARSALRRRRVARLFARTATREELGESADAPAVRDAERTRVLAAIDALPRRQREAVVLRYYEDLPVAEIAAILGISPGAVSTALGRARESLSNSLEDPDGA